MECPRKPNLVSSWRGAAELYVAQRERKRYCGQRDQHKHPKDVDISEQGGLCLHLLADPVQRLLLRLEERASLLHEILRYLVQRVLILRAGRHGVLNEPALVELLAVRQRVGGDRDAD